MSKILIILLVLLLYGIYTTSAQSTTWRYASDTLRYPVGVGSAEGAMAYVNKYDTVPVKFKLEGDDDVYKGYKFVYKKNGFYIDDPDVTINVFFDIRRRRIYNVHSYYFVSSFD